MPITGYPSVPTKERIASKLTVVSYQISGVTGEDWVVTSTAVVSTTLTVTMPADPSITAGDVLLFYDTGVPELDGLQIAAGDSAGADPYTVTVTVPSGTVGSTGGGMIKYPDFTPTSQVTDWSANTTGATDTWSTLGTTLTEEANETTRPVTLTVYLRKGLDQIGPILGVSDPEVDPVDLDPDSNVHILVSNWDGRVGSSLMQNYTFMQDIEWNDWQEGQSAGDFVQWTLSGNATNKFSKAVPQT